MREVFFEQLKEMFIQDKNVFFLTGDTGFNLVEPFFEMAPKRAINVGVAEQNLIGIAAGLCNVGYIPICYAITNFLVHRCLEQIRDDICLHKYKVILVGTSTGFDNGGLGATHHMLDDIACMKPLPNINIFSPSGKKSMTAVLSEALLSTQASFIRLSKGAYLEEVSVVNANHFIYESNTEILVISHGKMVKHCAEAFQISLDFSLFAMDRIKPLDDAKLKELFGRYGKIIVVEDNFNSGLFNSICQWLVENQLSNQQIYSISPMEGYEERAGDAKYLEDKNDLSPKKIAERIARIR